jgi:hypothetical protein
MEQQNYCIYKEGWLQKRGNIHTIFFIFVTILLTLSGEHIKTWRPRYFILRNDGYFFGFNSKPNSNEDISTPNNSFFIKGKLNNIYINRIMNIFLKNF